MVIEAPPNGKGFDPTKPFTVAGVTYWLDEGDPDLLNLWRFTDPNAEGRKMVLVGTFTPHANPMEVFIAACENRRSTMVTMKTLPAEAD